MDTNNRHTPAANRGEQPMAMRVKRFRIVRLTRHPADANERKALRKWLSGEIDTFDVGILSGEQLDRAVEKYLPHVLVVTEEAPPESVNDIARLVGTVRIAYTIHDEQYRFLELSELKALEEVRIPIFPRGDFNLDPFGMEEAVSFRLEQRPVWKQIYHSSLLDARWDPLGERLL